MSLILLECLFLRWSLVLLLRLVLESWAQHQDYPASMSWVSDTVDMCLCIQLSLIFKKWIVTVKVNCDSKRRLLQNRTEDSTAPSEKTLRIKSCHKCVNTGVATAAKEMQLKVLLYTSWISKIQTEVLFAHTKLAPNCVVLTKLWGGHVMTPSRGQWVWQMLLQVLVVSRSLRDIVPFVQIIQEIAKECSGGHNLKKKVSLWNIQEKESNLSTKLVTFSKVGWRGMTGRGARQDMVTNTMCGLCLDPDLSSNCRQIFFF